MEGEELPESREQEFIETDEDAQVRHRKPTNPAGEALSTRNFLRLALVGGAGVVAAAALAGGTDLLSRPAKAASGQPILIDNTNDGSERTILVSSGPTGLGTVGAFEVFSQTSSGDRKSTRLNSSHGYIS